MLDLNKDSHNTVEKTNTTESEIIQDKDERHSAIDNTLLLRIKRKPPWTNQRTISITESKHFVFVLFIFSATKQKTMIVVFKASSTDHRPDLLKKKHIHNHRHRNSCTRPQPRNIYFTYAYRKQREQRVSVCERERARVEGANHMYSAMTFLVVSERLRLRRSDSSDMVSKNTRAEPEKTNGNNFSLSLLSSYT